MHWLSRVLGKGANGLAHGAPRHCSACRSTVVLGDAGRLPGSGTLPLGRSRPGSSELRSVEFGAVGNVVSAGGTDEGFGADWREGLRRFSVAVPAERVSGAAPSGASAGVSTTGLFSGAVAATDCSELAIEGIAAG